MNWELTIKTLLLTAALLELLCVIAACKSLRKTALALFISGWLVCLGIFTINYILAKAPPFGNMYQVMSFMPLILAPLYLYVSLVQKRPWLLGYFAATSLIALTGAFFMPFQAHWSQMPALQSPWFVPHVSAYILSYSLATVGTLLAGVSCFKRDEQEQSFLDASSGMILLAFPFMTFGLWSGALWADEAWGGYWSWDMKEVWSLITWGLYLAYFHLGGITGGKKYKRPALFTAYVALLITFLIVNLLPKITSLHSYAM